MNIRQIFLLVTGIGLIPIALSYGVLPQKSLSYLFDVSISNINGSHIFRAVMGLYLSLLSFWIVGAFRVELRQAALYSLTVFMFGLAAGRVLSLIVDGVPSLLLIAYLVLEIICGTLGLILLKKSD